MENMNIDTLKSCPFCGGEAEFYRTPIKTNCCWCDSVVVRCKNCEARTARVLYDARKHRNDSEYDEAAEAWNTRKPLERIKERIIDATDNLTGTGVLGVETEFILEILKEEGGL